MNDRVRTAFIDIFVFSCIVSLFFLCFPLCRVEADLLVTAKYGYFRTLLPLAPVIDVGNNNNNKIMKNISLPLIHRLGRVVDL